MTRRTYGILAGVIGLGAWWWNRQRSAANKADSPVRGTVIYRNTPAAARVTGEGVI